MSNGYYIDTCIWLNLFKKEGNPSKGKPCWEIAEEFIEKAKSEEGEIIYPGVVLRELQLKLDEKGFREKTAWLEACGDFKKIKTLKEDEIAARKLESEYCFEISFYDFLHLVISRRLNLVLVTRDKKLMMAAKENGVDAKKPEEITGC